MKMIITNLGSLQYSLDVPLADGQVIRELIEPRDTIEILDIDPWDVNTYKILRNEVFVTQNLYVCFESEPDDLPCLFDFARLNLEKEGVPVAGTYSTLNFKGSVTVVPSATPGTADITITGSSVSGVVTIDSVREYVTLLGAQDDSNLVYTIPDKAINDPPKLQLKVYRNGVRCNPGAGNDYTVSESGGAGTGYDTITFATGTAPRADECLWADYVLFGT